MSGDYIFVDKNYRKNNPNQADYMERDDYLNMMKEDNGLEYNLLCPFEIPRGYDSFKVININKAFTFSMKNSEYTKKPDKYLFF
jgi:hypothetical protein